MDLECGLKIEERSLDEIAYMSEYKMHTVLKKEMRNIKNTALFFTSIEKP